MDNVLATIKDAGYIPISVGALDGWPLAHIWSDFVHTNLPIDFIAGLESGDPSSTWNDPRMIEATVKLKEWADAGYFQDDILATSYMDGNNLFINSEAAINIGGTWNNSTFASQPEFEVRFFPVPQMNPDLPWHLNGYTPNNAFMVPVYTEHLDLAIQFVDYMLSEEVATAKWDAGDIVAYMFDEVPPPVFPLQADVYEAMQGKGTGYYLGNYDSEVQAVSWQVLQEVVVGASTPEDAMDQIQAVYESIAND
jgi:ABC-type glycerol-3-phosphate transport system substrate-binding protein